jgi:hypothetical protein
MQPRLTPTSKKNRNRLKTALIILGLLVLSAAVAAAIVFGGGLPLIPFAPLLVAAVVNPFAVMGILAAGVAAGLTLLGGLAFGVAKLGKLIRNKIHDPKPEQKNPTTAAPTPIASLAAKLLADEQMQQEAYKGEVAKQMKQQQDDIKANSKRSEEDPALITWHGEHTDKGAQMWHVYKESLEGLPADIVQGVIEGLEEVTLNPSGLRIYFTVSTPGGMKVSDILYEETRYPSSYTPKTNAPFFKPPQATTATPPNPNNDNSTPPNPINNNPPTLT